jgi:hypothetical protein
LYLDLAQCFDGHNEQAVLERLRAKYTVALVPDARRFRSGLLSRHENDVISRGAEDVIRGYLTDVIDRDGRPALLLKNGESRAIERDSWFINCTGYLTPREMPYEPYVSASGKVISIQRSSALHLQSASAAYFAVHLSYLDKLHVLPLYELDQLAMNRADSEALIAVNNSHTLYNCFFGFRQSAAYSMACACSTSLSAILTTSDARSM